MNAITPISATDAAADTHPAATSAPPSLTLRASSASDRLRMSGDASLAPLPPTGGVGDGHDPCSPPLPGAKPVPTFAEGARDTIFSPRSQGAFLEHLSTNGNVRLACRAAAVSPQTAYRARRKSPAFAALWDAALLSARAHAEEVLAERALGGWEEAVFYHGEEVATRRRYSDRLLLAHLARLDRLAECEDVSAALADLDEAIAALGRGEEIEEPLRDRASAGSAPPQGERNYSVKDRVPGVPSCRTSPAPGGGENGEYDGYYGDDVDIGPDDPMWLGNRLDRMDAARPADAPLPHELGDAGIVEMLQLAAFEAGEDEWWLIGRGPARECSS